MTEQSMREPARPSMNAASTEHSSNRLKKNWEWFKKKCVAVLAIFLAGYFITLIWVYAAGYPSLPFQGEVTMQENGDLAFSAYYPKFRQYAVVESRTEAGTESLFSQSGMLLTGAFFYTVTNAPHWIFELNVSNLRGLIAVPLMVLLIGCFVFYQKFTAPQNQSPDQALQFGIGVGLMHGLLVSATLIVGNLISSPFGEMYAHPKFYGGQFAGNILPGVAIIMLTGLFYGAISGGLLSFYVSMKQNAFVQKVIAQSAPKSATHAKQAANAK